MDGAPKRRWGDGRCAFHAHARAIRQELTKGRSLTSIYDEYRDRLGIGYTQFTRYIHALKHNRTQPDAAPPTPSARRPEPTARVGASSIAPGGASQAANGLPTFHFDPMDAYKQKFD